MAKSWRWTTRVAPRFNLLQGARDDRARKIARFISTCSICCKPRGRSSSQPAVGAAQSLAGTALRAKPATRFVILAKIGGDAKALLREVKRRGLEGIIGKQTQIPFTSPIAAAARGSNSRCLNEQEFVIGGYTPPAGARKHFGALLVGYYEKKRLLFAGKVGTGFDSELLAALHKRFREETRDDCPFADLPSKQDGKWVLGITPAMMRRIHWVNPVFVCQVKFAEWTRDGKLRQPVFLGLREDKSRAGREARRMIATFMARRSAPILGS